MTVLFKHDFFANINYTRQGKVIGIVLECWTKGQEVLGLIPLPFSVLEAGARTIW